MTIAVTFDFHGTLATCDRWFQIEVFTLISEVLGWIDLRNGTALTGEFGARGDAIYRDIRREVVDSGFERDALACARQTLDILGIDLPSVSVQCAVDQVMRSTLADARPIPGAVEAIGYLSDSGIPIGIVSSAAYHPFLEWTVEQFGISGYLRTLVTSASCGFYKSRHDIYLHAAEQLGVAPERCVHIGDSYVYDVVSSRRAGMKAVWLRTGNQAPDGPCPDLTIDSLVGIGPILVEKFGIAR